MAADQSRKGISKEIVLSFFTFFFKSCFGCFQQPPEEAVNLAAGGKKSPVNHRNVVVPISHPTSTYYAAGSTKKRVNDNKNTERRGIQSEMQITRRKRSEIPIGSDLKVGDGDEIKSIVGAFIVSVTLIVMLVWGKLCAIICAALWLYFVPRFRANNNSNGWGLEMKDRASCIDIDSWDYKNKVVFEGFLERDHRVIRI